MPWIIHTEIKHGPYTMNSRYLATRLRWKPEIGLVFFTLVSCDYEGHWEDDLKPYRHSLSIADITEVTGAYAWSVWRRARLERWWYRPTRPIRQAIAPRWWKLKYAIKQRRKGN